jgi:hypothetical protein
MEGLPDARRDHHREPDRGERERVRLIEIQTSRSWVFGRAASRRPVCAHR